MRAITLNQSREPAEGTGLRLLHTLFSSSLSPDERAEILERDYSIVFNQEEKKMFDMFRYAEENGRTKGRREGRKQGRMEGRAEGRAEGRMEGIRKGIKQGIEIVAAKALRNKMTPSDVHEITGLEVARILEIAKEIGLGANC